MFPSLDKFVIETASQKAQEVAERLNKSNEDFELIIAADTTVSFNGKVYGKPQRDDKAIEMLKE
jgi:predicted house-cleaning NTP pyrophosphatase (Maf/HAM1 superfamily)